MSSISLTSRTLSDGMSVVYEFNESFEYQFVYNTQLSSLFFASSHF